MTKNHLSYAARIFHTVNPCAQQLLQLMADKQTNLALSADVTKAQDLLTLADHIGPEICILKTHIDIISDFTPDLIQRLQQLAKKHRFLLFEDRKFADIGSTVKAQYEGGVYRIADWADMVNAHSLPGPGIIQGLASAGLAKQRGLILLAEMSSAGHLMGPDYMQQTFKMATVHPEFVFGFITQHALSPNPQWLYFTPGVKLTAESDGLGQQYVTPERAILEHGSDVIIVGRGIIKANDPVATAHDYRQQAWHAYEKRIGQAIKY